MSASAGLGPSTIATAAARFSDTDVIRSKSEQFYRVRGVGNTGLINVRNVTRLIVEESQ